ELTDQDVLQILEKMVKQRRDSIAQYEQASRADLAEQEAFEIGVIQAYMPAALGEAEIAAIVDAAIAATGAKTMPDMGKVMAQVKPQVQGRADMGSVSALVKSKLAG
ncbi:MAG: GatB/YqeY domain-containing protein, partial [Gammaproteobacteria bacterium]|nr:GatB/YqeY domain-containing protein [Gammaproteobacteria bacterium]